MGSPAPLQCQVYCFLYFLSTHLSPTPARPPEAMLQPVGFRMISGFSLAFPMDKLDPRAKRPRTKPSNKSQGQIKRNYFVPEGLNPATAGNYTKGIRLITKPFFWRQRTNARNLNLRHSLFSNCHVSYDPLIFEDCKTIFGRMPPARSPVHF